MNVYRKYRVLIVCAAVAAAVLAYFVSSYVESRLARQRVESLMEPAIHDMREDLLAGMDHVLFYLASCVRRVLPSVEAAKSAPEKVDALMRTLKLDEINFADTNGVIRATTHPTQLNYWMGTDPDPEKAAGYLCLLTNRLWYTQPPRITVQADDVYRKFVGVRLPDGYLQLGFDFSRLSRDLKARFADVAVGWHVGESGYYILADRYTGEVISNGNPDSDFSPGLDCKPKTLRGLGFSMTAIRKAGNKSFEADIEGVKSICRTAVVKESGHRMCVVVPMGEITRTRNISVGTMMFILLVMIVTVASVALRMVTLRERAEEARLAEEARRQKELTLAASIQSAALPSVFPPFPSIADRVDIYALMRAAKEVGGDFYDFYFVNEHSVAVVIADVSGKGVPGAMFMMRAKTALNDLLAHGGELEEAVATVNERLADGNHANMFVTAWIGVINLETGVVEYVNCGHNPPVVRHADGTVEWVRPVSGLALAALEGVRYAKQSFTLRPGDMLFMYTDGVTEAQSKGELFGESRLAAALETDVPNATGACNIVQMAVDAFAAGEQQADDITMLALGFTGGCRAFMATADGLAAAAEYIKGFCDDPRAAVVIDEIASNIVRCSGAATFDLAYLYRKDGYALVFRDAGTPFNPLERPDPDVAAPPEDRAVGGLGIFMVRRMAASVGYARHDGRNVLTVEMKRV